MDIKIKEGTLVGIMGFNGKVYSKTIKIKNWSDDKEVKKAFLILQAGLSLLLDKYFNKKG